MDLILIHGMGRTPLSMLILKRRLMRLGHSPHLFGYSSTFESLNQVTQRLLDVIHRYGASGGYGLIGHSLGTVIIRHTLPLLSDQPSVCFFLAPPIVACKAAKLCSRLWPYRLLTGEMGQLLSQERFMDQLPMPHNVIIYAGIAGPRAAWLPLGQALNDGILTVDEASGHGSNKTIHVSAFHSFIMNSKVVFKDMALHLPRHHSTA